jgi:hypothetical protein
MIVSIMQPTYLPWLGYFDLIDQVDLFIFLDNVQFAKRSWQQRNQIKTPHGMEWLTVPALVKGRFHQTIAEVSLCNTEFAAKHLDSIRNSYIKCPFFQDYFKRLSEEVSRWASVGRLVELNCGLIGHLCRELGISTPIIRASELHIHGRRSDLLARLCQAVNGDVYISALGSSAYLLNEIQEFSDCGVKIQFQHFKHPTYRQAFPPFIPQASIVDLVFNEGDRSLEILRSGRQQGYSVEEAKSLADAAAIGQGHQ